MLFRLKERVGGYEVGSHTQDGRIYYPGDIIESSSDLVKQFPNKFERLGEDVKVSKGSRFTDHTKAEDIGKKKRAEAIDPVR